MLKLVFFLIVWVLVKGLTLWNTILIHNTVTQVAEGVIEDNRRAQFKWIVNISGCAPLKPFNGQFLKEAAIGLLLEI